MHMSRITIPAFALFLFVCTACTPPAQESVSSEHSQSSDSSSSVQSTVYTNERLGFSVDVPATVTAGSCVRLEKQGQQYALPSGVVVPLVQTEVRDAVVFHPERFDEIFGESRIGDEPYYADCKTRAISGALLDRKMYHEYPLWTVVTESVKSEKDIPKSVLRNCTAEAKFTGLEPATQTGVLTVGIDVDMRKTDDSSAIFCPDLVYAKYVPATKKLYYLFQSGPYYDDRAVEQIPASLRFETNR